ncbi:hypothetical protein ACA910_019445 [Epithemia clementina (nom. ined.)]
MFSSIKRRLTGGGTSQRSSSHGSNKNNNDSNTKPSSNKEMSSTSAATTSDSHPYGRAHSAPSRSLSDTTTPGRTTTTKRLSSLGSNKEEEMVLQWIQKVPQLANFDSCVAAADALAAASIPIQEVDNDNNAESAAGDDDNEERTTVVTCSNSSLTRLDKATGLVHTSVLISPNGTLLLVPPGITRENLPFSNYFAQQQRRPTRRGAPPPNDLQALPLSLTTTQVQEEDFKQGQIDSVDTKVRGDNDDKAQPEATEDFAPKNDSDPTDAGQGAVEKSDSKENIETNKADEMGAMPEQEHSDSKTDTHPLHRMANSFDSSDSRDSIFSELLWNSKGEYAAAVFLGHDLDPQGDWALNGFSAKGWSLPATSFALRQTQASLEHWADFCHSVILSRKETAVRTHQACDTLRSQIPILGGYNPPGTSASSSNNNSSNNADADWELVFDPKSDFAPTIRRGGPLLGTADSALNRALVLVEEYFSQSSEAESATWRQATVQESAIIPQLRKSIEEFQTRMTAREQALEESSKRARLLEDRMNKLKKQRDKKWDQVYKAEERVTRRMEALWKERTRQREKARLVQLRETNNNTINSDTHTRQKSSEQVWDMVASLSDNMDSTSFEPMQLPDISASSKSVSSDEGSGPTPLMSASSMEELNNKNNNISKLPAAVTATPTETISREAMEEEVRLPELRATAMAADDAIEECAFQLLTVLSNLDTTRRSARVAAETALLAAANVQASTLKSMISLERMALQERLRHLDQLEEQMTDVDVRADLNEYINADKKDRGGQSHLGDDEDGGIASALAILSSHAESAVHGEYAESTLHDDEDEVDCAMNKTVSRAQIEKAVADLFEEPAESSTLEPAELNNAVDLLCTVAKETSKTARRRRSTFCYSLNSKRSGNAELQSEAQFEGLVKVFDAMLSSCANEEDVAGGMSNAKMLMMLAQTFYLPKDESSDPTAIKLSRSSSSTGSVASDFESRKGRSRRLYIKSRLTNHKIWSKDEFWDVALKQQISESLTQSGVIMSNFERSARAQRGGDGEYRKSRKIKWHDLSLEERVGAASQVHAVVFAQLGALAHSMIEFGCGLQRSCAFVRRMAIRHQLPSAQRTMLLQHLMARWEDEKSKQRQVHQHHQQQRIEDQDDDHDDFKNDKD